METKQYKWWQYDPRPDPTVALATLEARRPRPIIHSLILAGMLGVFASDFYLGTNYKAIPFLVCLPGFYFYLERKRASPYFKHLGYNAVSQEQWLQLIRWFGLDGVKRLPPWADLKLVPGVDEERQFEAVRDTLTSLCWGCDPALFPIFERGYREMTDEQAAALANTFAPSHLFDLPTAGESAPRRERAGLSQFEYVLAWLEERHDRNVPNREALLAQARAAAAAPTPIQS